MLTFYLHLFVCAAGKKLEKSTQFKCDVVKLTNYDSPQSSEGKHALPNSLFMDSAWTNRCINGAFWALIYFRIYLESYPQQWIYTDRGKSIIRDWLAQEANNDRFYFRLRFHSTRKMFELTVIMISFNFFPVKKHSTEKS